jgi:hypothetical protein
MYARLAALSAIAHLGGRLELIKRLPDNNLMLFEALYFPFMAPFGFG